MRQDRPADPCLRFEYKTAFTGDNAPTNEVQGSVLRSTLNHGIGSYNTFGLVVQNNVVHRSFRNSIDVDAKSRQIPVDNNFVVGNLRSPDYTNEWIQPFAGIYIQTTNLLSVKGNVVSGSDDTGITIRPELCSTTKPVLVDNEVQGAMVGLFILSRNSPTCNQITRFTAWTCSHLGIVAVESCAGLRLCLRQSHRHQPQLHSGHVHHKPG
jgi:hypothetical protein